MPEKRTPVTHQVEISAKAGTVASLAKATTFRRLLAASAKAKASIGGGGRVTKQYWRWPNYVALAIGLASVAVSYWTNGFVSVGVSLISLVAGVLASKRGTGTHRPYVEIDGGKS